MHKIDYNFNIILKLSNKIMPPRALEYTHSRPIIEQSIPIEMFDDICDTEDEYTDECCDKGTYIGIPVYDTLYHVNLLASRVSSKSFFDYDIEEVMEYLTDNNIVETNIESISPDIMQVHVDDSDAFTVVLKTHWLRLVQRKWKNVLQRRKNIMCNPNYILNREITGKSLTTLPSLRGMLSNL
jgi:hypothetical protein